MAQTKLTAFQIDTLAIVEKASAVLSLIGTTLIIITFLSMKSFRRLSTTLIFYASFSNVLSNIAHLIGISGITAGQNNALCQVQGFLQQMFEPADVLCSLGMAINVYLAIFHQYDSASLRQLTGRYLILCYGLPFVPAFVLLFISSEDRGRVYGNATLWCWISNDWESLRIALFYAPIWVIMFITIVIYILVGKAVFEKRAAIRKLSYGGSHLNTNDGKPFSGIKTTEVQICSSNGESGGLCNGSALNDRPPSRMTARRDQYSVTISSLRPDEEGQTRASPPLRATPHTFNPVGLDSITWSYTKCAALFAASLLITWVPSSTNRMYSLVLGRPNYPLNILSALVIPLQGFWNAIIFFTASRAVCKAAWNSRPSVFSRNSNVQLDLISNRNQGTGSTTELCTKLSRRS
ncbi:related to G protein coupled receptor like protein [Phialocephala subalpina]|uniref:Related to G protein coupled receptor like protein n=1 Tax=Phialocephala subalpina TaxID=576137 RepID=A0A1L7WFG1_9HELO|nr:related to G protein coupled receptor like protein [Phialocephala subalpina]